MGAGLMSPNVEISIITTIHNIEIGINISINNPLDDNILNEYFRNNKENKYKEASFSLYESLAYYLF